MACVSEHTIQANTETVFSNVPGLAIIGSKYNGCGVYRLGYNTATPILAHSGVTIIMNGYNATITCQNNAICWFFNASTTG